MKKFIPFKEFEHFYGEAPLHKLYMMRKYGSIQPSAFSKKDNILLLDINFLFRRKDFQRKVRSEAHDNFYFLTQHNSYSYIAKLLFKIDDSHSVHCWITFLSSGLFRSADDDILSYKTDMMLMKFYRYSRWLIRGLFVIKNVKPWNRDINVLLDMY